MINAAGTYILKRGDISIQPDYTPWNGEFCVDQKTGFIYVGDGENSISELPILAELPAHLFEMYGIQKR